MRKPTTPVDQVISTDHRSESVTGYFTKFGSATAPPTSCPAVDTLADLAR
ncbi:hypothetical protein [Tessaracoccus defluvii]|nr:hypothetical protein [Tessaracoccus defluvii]